MSKQTRMQKPITLLFKIGNNFLNYGIEVVLRVHLSQILEYVLRGGNFQRLESAVLSNSCLKIIKSVLMVWGKFCSYTLLSQLFNISPSDWSRIGLNSFPY